jgi:hypothetical protein
MAALQRKVGEVSGSSSSSSSSSRVSEGRSSRIRGSRVTEAVEAAFVGCVQA